MSTFQQRSVEARVKDNSEYDWFSYTGTAFNKLQEGLNMSTFLARATTANTIESIKWRSGADYIKTTPAFKILKADVLKGGGKLSIKSNSLIMKSSYVSPNPLERSKWKQIQFYPGSGSNTSIYEKSGLYVKLVFPGGLWYVSVGS